MKNGDAPAFPTPFLDMGSGPVLGGDPGLSKREYMATHILAAIIRYGHEDQDWGCEIDSAVEYADDLLRALEKKEGDGSWKSGKKPASRSGIPSEKRGLPASDPARRDSTGNSRSST